MKVLAIGASGYVGTLVLPHMKEHHEFVVFDRKPPADASLAYIQADVTDIEAVQRAVQGCQAVIYLAMGLLQKRNDDIVSAYDVNVKGVHIALEAARQAGIKRFIYTSTGSVYGYQPPGGFTSEDLPCRPAGVYSLTKYLGELVCEHFARVHGMSVLALRLWHPVTNEEWQGYVNKRAYVYVTGARDVARAYLRCLEIEHTGFDAIFIAGDHAHKVVHLNKAKRLLGWEPTYVPEPVSAQT